MKVNNTPEEHPLFPSGDWEGFYKYRFAWDIRKHEMNFQLDFQNGTITGSGSDDVGVFSWVGTYSIDSMTCNMTKFYHDRHTVAYKGNVDENGIWGTWSLSDLTGGFHIWPSQNGAQTKAEEEEKEEEVINNLN
ncbi:MAG: hypothetical protein MK226_05665 [Saprospiraceae bacterium]|jgi:hypothetical protein|nr:hypothetical protein [Saprospiraceae bacterium]